MNIINNMNRAEIGSVYAFCGYGYGYSYGRVKSVGVSHRFRGTFVSFP